jgi:TonB family protein
MDGPDKVGRPPDCPPTEMKKNVARDRSFGGAIDRSIVEQRFSPGPLPEKQLGEDEVLVFRLAVRLDIDAAGKLTSCTVMERNGPPAAPDPCEGVAKAYRPRPGADGKPAPFRATEAFTTVVHIDRTHPPEPVPLSGSQQGLISPDDYPAEALDRGDQGRVGVLIRTDATGAVIDCTVEESSASPILDKQTCELARTRAKFKPALDRQGRATAGEYRTRISWKIEEDRTPSDPWVSRTVIDFAPDGRPLSCRIELEGAMKPTAGTAPPACPSDPLARVPRKFGDLPGALASVIVEQRFADRRGLAPSVPAGDILVARQVIDLEIDATGQLTSCKAIEGSDKDSSYDPCEEIERTYVPRQGVGGKPVPFKARETISLYVRVQRLAGVARGRRSARLAAADGDART